MQTLIGVEEVSRVGLYQSLLAEFLGTLTMVFFGVSTFSVYGPISETQISLCFGLVTSSLVMAFGHISGANLNPAVTLALMCARVVSVVRAFLYILVQIAGATAGAGLIYSMKSKEDTLFGIIRLRQHIKPIEGFVIEMIGTMIIVMVYLTVTDPRRTGLRNTAFLSIGIAVTTAHLAAYPYTGAGLNPARSFATTAVNRETACKNVCWKNHWVFWIGPLLGAVIAAIIYRLLLTPRGKAEGSDECSYEHNWC